MIQRRGILASLCGVTAVALSGCLSTFERMISRVDESTFCIVRRDGTEQVAVTYDQVVSAGEPDYKINRGYHIKVRLSAEGVDSWSAAIEEIGGYESPDETRAEFYVKGRSVVETAVSTDDLQDVKDGQREFILGGMDSMSDAEAVATEVN